MNLLSKRILLKPTNIITDELYKIRSNFPHLPCTGHINLRYTRQFDDLRSNTSLKRFNQFLECKPCRFLNFSIYYLYCCDFNDAVNCCLVTGSLNIIRTYRNQLPSFPALWDTDLSELAWDNRISFLLMIWEAQLQFLSMPGNLHMLYVQLHILFWIRHILLLTVCLCFSVFLILLKLC